MFCAIFFKNCTAVKRKHVHWTKELNLGLPKQ